MCSPNISMREIGDAVYIKVDAEDDMYVLLPSVLRQNDHILV